MARRMKYLSGLCLILTLAFAAAGCGVKSPPLPADSNLPPQAADLKAKAVADGVEVVFTVPEAAKPEMAVHKALLYYGYLPLSGDPDCPPCPPKLRKFHELPITDAEGNPSKLMQGGTFRYVDTAAPIDMQAVYQVVLVDASGRVGKPTAVVRAPRVEEAAATAVVLVEAGDGVVTLTWEEVKTLAGGKVLEDLAGYIVVRQETGEKGVVDEKQLNTRPLTEAKLVDKTVQNGRVYVYRVHAVRGVGGANLPGKGSAWVTAKPNDQVPPDAPTDLAAVSHGEGVYLRFTPAQAEDVVGYLVFRKVKSTGEWLQVSQDVVSENTYIDQGVEKGKVYLYRAVSVDAAGNRSEFSKTLEIRHNP